MSNKVYEIITDKIIEGLKKDIIPWRKPWNSTTAPPRNATSNKYYTGVNIMVLAAENRTNPYWCTFKQCVGLGGTVEKGQKGTPIVFWKISDRPDPANPDKMKKSFICRYYTVFNIEQTTLKDDERFKIVPQVHEDPIQECEDLVSTYINRNGPKIEHGYTKAAYSPSMDKVIMPNRSNFEEITGYYATLFHELVHSTGHKSRLDRPDHVIRGDENYSKEELVAEIGASFLCCISGIEPEPVDNRIAYIQSWIAALENDPRLIISAASQAEKAVKHMRGEA